MNVSNMLIIKQLALHISSLISGFTRVVNTMGCTPVILERLSMSLATCAAFSTESTNGFLISRNGVLNWLVLIGQTSLL